MALGVGGLVGGMAQNGVVGGSVTNNNLFFSTTTTTSIVGGGGLALLIILILTTLAVVIVGLGLSRCAPFKRWWALDALPVAAAAT